MQALRVSDLGNVLGVEQSLLSRPVIVGTALVSIVLVALAIDADVLRVLITNSRYLGDFTVFWTAARVDPAQVYDAEFMTRARYALVQQPGIAPFVNPPSALALLTPFGRLPFGAALLAWVGLGLAAYLWAASRMLSWRQMPLLLISPPLWIAAATGQLSMLVGAALIGGVCALQRRPILAGALFAAAALLKPHMALFVPLALLAAREWRALFSAVATGAAVGLACVAVQGVDLWLAWLQAVKDFPALIQSAGLMKSGVTPASLPLPALLRPFITPAATIVGAVLVWLGFSRTEDSAYRLISLVVGAMLASPYGRKYDLAAMQPAIVLLLLHPRRDLLTIITARFHYVERAAGCDGVSRPGAERSRAGSSVRGANHRTAWDARRSSTSPDSRAFPLNLCHDRELSCLAGGPHIPFPHNTR